MIGRWLRFGRPAAKAPGIPVVEPQPAPDPQPLAPFAEVLAAPDFVSGAWHVGDSCAHYFQHSPGADAFVFAASRGNWVRPEIPWSDFAAGDAYRQLRGNPSAIATTDVELLACLLTTLIRGDRFNEGLLASAFNDGTLLAVARRMAVLAEQP